MFDTSDIEGEGMAYPAGMTRVRIAIAAGTAASMGVAALIIGHYPDEGPYVSLTATHGIHAGDVVLLVLWAVVVGGLWRWTRRPVRGEDRARQ